MRERLSAFWASVKELWARTSRRVRVLFFLVLGGIFALSLVVVIMLNQTDYIVLYDNLAVDENAGVLAQLQEMGVQGKLDGTRLLIPAKDELRVRMQLATKGYPDSGFNYDIYAMGGGLTATQYDKTRYDTFNTQERLQATIETIPEVREAYVIISIPENDLFTLAGEEKRPSVSIMIKKMPGRTLTGEQVQGILNIVRTAIPGLDESDISVTDEVGDMRRLLELSSSDATKFELVETVNEALRRRILTMLQPIYGDGKVVVAVNSVLDTDESVTNTERYVADPDNPILDYREEEYERDNGTAIVQGVPGANDNTDVPQYGAEVLDDGTGTYYHSHGVWDYLVSSEKNQIIKAGFAITDVTVAVVIDATALPDGERAQIMDLVAKASGVENEKVSVQNIQFARSAIPDVEVTDNTMMRNLLIWTAIALLALIIIFTIIILWLARRRKEAEYEASAVAAASAVEDDFSADMIPEEEFDEDGAFEPLQIPETAEQKLKAQIKDLAISDPEIVAQLLKNWMMSP